MLRSFAFLLLYPTIRDRDKGNLPTYKGSSLRKTILEFIANLLSSCSSLPSAVSFNEAAYKSSCAPLSCFVFIAVSFLHLYRPPSVDSFHKAAPDGALKFFIFPPAPLVTIKSTAGALGRLPNDLSHQARNHINSQGANLGLFRQQSHGINHYRRSFSLSGGYPPIPCRQAR